MRQVKDRFRRIVERALDVRIVRPGGVPMLFEQEHLERFFKAFAVDCVFDVGANEGQYAEMIRQRADYRGPIVSFEPIPEPAATLRGKAAIDSQWFVEEVALDADDGPRQFHVMADSQFSSFHRPSQGGNALFAEKNKVERQIEVKGARLDGYVAKYASKLGFKRPFLKMDTQGHDLAVAAGAGATLGQFVGVQSELAVRGLYEGAPSYLDSINFFKQHGFELSAFVPNNGGHFPVLIEIDCILINSVLLGQFALG